MVHRVNSIRNEIAAEMRAAVSRSGVSRRDLAERVGMVPDTLYRKLRAERSFTIEELLDLAAALGVAPSALLPRTEVAA